jgi:hypothetical protein
MKLKKISLLTIIFTLILSINVYADDIFNYKNVYNITNELSQDKYRGRLAGDRGNNMAEQLIVDYFKSEKLKPIGDNGTYLQKFDVYVPSVDGACYFKVLDNTGKLIKEYKYGTEFKEAYQGSSSNGIVNGTIKEDVKESGVIYLSKGRSSGESPSTYEQDEALMAKGVKAVIYPYSSNMRFRSPYKQQVPYNKGLVKVYVSQNLISELEDYIGKNYTFEIKSTVNFKKVSVNNVLGMIEGSDKSLPPVILSAHFDHVGYDADGMIYPGALDNASGTAMLIEAARVLKGNNSGKRTIIIAAFNAEEEGLLGSKYFVQHPTVSIKDAECINFDMVGTVKDIPLSVLSTTTRTSFATEILDMARNASVVTNVLYENNSDHASFCFAGYDAVTLIHDDIDKIHSPADSIVNFNENKLDDVSATLEKFLNNKGILEDVSTSAKIYSFRDKIYLPAALVLSIIIIAVVFYELRKNRMEH